MSDPVVQTQSYGKSQVRVSRIACEGDQHRIAELTVWIELQGDFDAAYTDADNSLIVPTDTVKNTVYVLASQHGIDSIEAFCSIVAEHFLQSYDHVDLAVVHGEETLRDRLQIGGQPHPHAFEARSEQNTCDVVAMRDGIALSAGFAGLEVLKTTASSFAGYHQCENTTLQPVGDRIFATSIEASWPCGDVEADWTSARRTIRNALVEVFATTLSPSVQATLYQMGRKGLEACSLIDEIHISLPNQHHLLADLSPFGLENPNEVFIPVSEPFGNIRATIARKESAE